ncbi:metallophosphoesterase family protein [Pseudokineococcus sp. 1T1Z-3]|uniref:metallophosphoesterase family protein n=1 Tax=Pseudokineococcus sp. 1T1Z-3 TaxID=3132745 RepID=UPI0030B66123
MPEQPTDATPEEVEAPGTRPSEPRRPGARRRAAAAWTALVLALGLVAAVYGVTSARATASLGPHVAVYEVTTRGEVAVDLGPLGALVVDSPLPLALGVDVEVAEIPAALTEIADGTTTVDLLGEDLARYLQLFSAPQATVDVVTRALVLDAVERWLVTWALLVGAAVLGRAALGRRRRAELAALGRRHRVPLALLLVAALVGAVVVAGLRPQSPRDAVGRGATPVLEGTPLEGARVTGRLAEVVDLVAGFVTDQVAENEAFYAEVTEDLERAWAQAPESDDAVRSLAAARLAPEDASVGRATAAPAGAGQAAAPDGSLPAGGAAGAGGEEVGNGADDGADDGAADGAGSADGETVTAADLQQVLEDDVVTALVVSDLHCNVGMADPLRRLVELSGTDVVLNAGDTTMNGTSVEQPCVRAVASAFSDVPVVVADGNHDSPETSAQEEAAGWVVLRGDVVEVAGLRVLGAPDPRATRLLQGTEDQAQRPTADELAEQLAETACDEDPDLLLVHDASIGVPALERGCAPALLAGHYHVRTDPEQVGQGVRYISSSTAGAVLDQLTVGPLNGTAEATLLRVDRETGDVLSWRLVSVTTGADVTVGPWQPWPQVAGDGPQGADAPPSLLPLDAGDGADDGDAGRGGDPGDDPGAPGQPALDEQGRPLDDAGAQGDGAGEAGAGAAADPGTATDG